MALLRYYIDLRSYSDNDREALANKLESHAFLFTSFLDKFGVYEVYWNSPESISQSLGIPKRFIFTTIPQS